MPGKVVVVGSSNTDFVFSCTEFPKPGETILGGAFKTAHGGKSANQAVAAALSGAETSFVGLHCGDIWGKAAKENMESHCINCDWFLNLKDFPEHDPHDPNLPSGIAMVLVNQTGENEIVVAHSANDYVKEWLIEKTDLKSADVIVCALEIPAEGVLAAAKAKGNAKFILNAAPMSNKLNSEMLRLADYLVLNHTECVHLCNKVSNRETKLEGAPLSVAIEVQGILKDANVNSGTVVFITLGCRGVVYWEGCDSTAVYVPAVSARVLIDSTGAGDCFVGWLASGIANGLPLREAVERCVKAASISVGKMGAQAAFPSLEDLSSDTTLFV